MFDDRRYDSTAAANININIQHSLEGRRHCSLRFCDSSLFHDNYYQVYWATQFLQFTVYNSPLLSPRNSRILHLLFYSDFKIMLLLGQVKSVYKCWGAIAPPNICKSSKSKNLKPGRHGMGKNGCTWSKSSGNPNDLKGINWEVFSWLIGGLIKDQENPAPLV